MRLIDADRLNEVLNINFGHTGGADVLKQLIDNQPTVQAVPIPNNATNGDVIKAMFGYDKVSEFMGYVRIMARVGNWFNDGVVAEFDKDWWNAPYEGSDTE